MKFLILLLALCVVDAKEDGIVQYDGCQVIAVKSVTKEQINFTKNLVNGDEFMFWSLPNRDGLAEILVRPEQYQDFIGKLEAIGMEWRVEINDVGQLMREERNGPTNDNRDMAWDEYQRYDTIVTWLNTLESNPVVTLSVIGQSFEGRDIHQVKISTGGAAKPAIFIDALFHAREWVSCSSATWIINELTSNTANYESLLSKFDFYIVPLVNPDGYEFAHTDNRGWRKTRNVNENSGCLGVDPNRSFSFYFGGESTSSNPCSDQYKGEEAFSIPETSAVRDAVKALQAEGVVHAYYTLHSSGQLWLLSWGYTQGAYPDDYPELLAWGESSVDAIEVPHGSTYRAGQGADILYGVGGASDDWAKNEGVKYVTTVELSGRAGKGFIVRSEEIIPVAEEVWAGIQVIETTV